MEHAKHPLTLQMPPGLGGIGEREFVKNIKSLGNLMVLYHGTTTILRIGDISLIDLKKLKVVAIGEIKTAPIEPGKLNVTLQFIGSTKSIHQFIKVPSPTESKSNPVDKLPQAIKIKLNKQMERISNTISATNKRLSSDNIHKEEKRHIKEFETLVNEVKAGKFSYQQLGPGLLCSVFRNKKGSLFSRLSPKKKVDFASKMNTLSQHVKAILLEGSSYNNILIGTLLYSEDGKPQLLPGTIPVFWWPIKTEILRKIIFHEIIVTNIYNPAHFVDKLEAKGFSIVPSKDARDFNLSISIGRGKMEIVGMWYFMRLISHDMFDESQVVEFLTEITENLSRRKPGSPEKHNIIFNHRFRF